MTPPDTLLNIVGVGLRCTLPSAARWEHHLVVTLPRLCEAVSSAPLSGGLRRVRAVVNRSVPKGWECDDPEADTARYVAGLGLEPGTTVGLTTAVSMADLRYADGSRGGWRVHTLVTAGVGNAAAAGGRFPLEVAAGTVNLIVLIEGSLSPAALVNAVGTATEAKTAAFRAAGVTTRFGEAATGTTTDTVTVVNLAAGPTSPYAGLATVPGFLIAETVYGALCTALGGT